MNTVFAAVNVDTVFTGEVNSIERKGNKLTARCKLGNGLFDAQLPVMLKGTMCSHLRGSPGDGTHLISQGCTGPDTIMLRSRWKFSAKVAAPISADFPFALTLSNLAGVGDKAAAALAANAVFVDWFANGIVTWGDGNAAKSRPIVSSTLPVAGSLVLSLKRYFPSLPPLNSIVTIYPGCDGMFNTCQAYNAATNPTGKFANSTDGTAKTSNFGGDPFTPIGNPTTTGQPDLNMGGTKK